MKKDNLIKTLRQFIMSSSNNDEVNEKNLIQLLQSELEVGGNSDATVIHEVTIVRGGSANFILKYKDLEIIFNEKQGSEVVFCSQEDTAKFIQFYNAVRKQPLHITIFNSDEADTGAMYDTYCFSSVNYLLCSNFLSISYSTYNFSSGGYKQSETKVLRTRNT